MEIRPETHFNEEQRRYEAQQAIDTKGVMMKEELFKCPECGSQKVTVSHLQRFMANTGDHWCHAVKTQDADSEATCLDCHWIGRREQLAGGANDCLSPKMECVWGWF